MLDLLGHCVVLERGVQLDGCYGNLVVGGRGVRAKCSEVGRRGRGVLK